MARTKNKSNKLPLVNIDDLSTWIKYKKGLCDDCKATCCTLPVDAYLSDLVRMKLISEFEAEAGNEKKVAKLLIKQGIIERFNSKTGVFTLTRMANGDCLYLDKYSRRCTIYETRPTTCREHPQVGPRPNHCAYIKA